MLRKLPVNPLIPVLQADDTVLESSDDKIDYLTSFFESLFRDPIQVPLPDWILGIPSA